LVRRSIQIHREGRLLLRPRHIKDGDAILITTLIRLKQEHFQPDRDVIVALTAGKESGGHHGVVWLPENHRDLIDAEYCVPVLPRMETGATDGFPLCQAGIPTYGVSGVFLDVEDNRAHGSDERYE
jgi:hypothetical protein